MKFGIYLLIFFTFFYSCKEQNKKIKSKSNTSLDVNLQSKDSVSNLKIEKVTSTFISDNFNYNGKLKDVIKWVDKEGTHIVFTGHKFYYSDYIYDTIRVDIDGEEKVINQETYKQNAEIFCYHYKLIENKYKLDWKLYDESLKCPMDALCKFINKSIEITDLNNDNIAEIWTMYRIACRGDISPSDLYLIMYENDKKYIIEGTSLIDIAPNEKYGGEISKITGFKKNDDFYLYALKKWKENLKDTFEE